MQGPAPLCRPARRPIPSDRSLPLLIVITMNSHATLGILGGMGPAAGIDLSKTYTNKFADEAAKRLRVERNADNPNRVDIYAPLDTVNPLDIIATNAVIYSQFR